MKTELEFADTIGKWRAAGTTNALHIADAASATWRDIDVALSPIIGQRGVTALLKRSLHLAKVNHPFLIAVHDPVILPDEFPALHAALSKETPENAIIINSTLLNTFYELLVNLIGAALTRQLLHSIFEIPSSDDPVQDTLS